MTLHAPRRAATVALTALLAVSLALPASAADTNPRTTGACAGAVTLQQPPATTLNGAVRIQGRAPELDPADAPATGTVTIKIRKRNTATYVDYRYIDARSLPADSGGNFSDVIQRLDDDYAVMASTQNCDSNVVVAKVKPTVAGPTSVPRGSRVTLTVTGVPNAPVKIAFHRAGVAEGYVVRRTGMTNSSGIYRTTYTANVDQSYYALVSNAGRRSAVSATIVR